jgi:hypothetical protein
LITLGLFSPLGALSELGVPEAVRGVVESAQAEAEQPGRILQAAWLLTWAKALHLIFLPVLDASRPWQLRYALGDGLLGVCRIAYRFDTMERFLGELTRLRVGNDLRRALCRTWVQILTEMGEPLHIYVDPHLKPHWTHLFMPCGKVATLNRVMPCTRQVMVTNAQGYVWEIIDQVGDDHLTHTLLGLEQEMEHVTGHAVTLTVADREANGLELAQKYAQSDHFALLTLLDSTASAGLIVGTPAFRKTFRLTGRWQPLATQAGESLAPAIWAPEQEASQDPRVFWLVRDDGSLKLLAVYSLSRPVADCAPDAAALLKGSATRTLYRARWSASENVIREMVHGDNLNENYGYDYRPVPNRLRQRQQAEAQAQVNTTQTQLANTQRQLAEVHARLAQYEQTWATQRAALDTARTERQVELHTRQQAAQPTRRVEQQLAQLDRQADRLDQRHVQRTHKIQTRTLAQLDARREQLEATRGERQAALAQIDIDQPMFERDLEKDQIMADFQAALLNAHRWCCNHYFTGEWSRLELETATARIYRQRGHVTYADDRVDVTLAAFAYRSEQTLAEAACARFNAARVHEAAGRLIVMAVAPFKHCVRHL